MTALPAASRPRPPAGRTRLVCSSCGAPAPKWQGRCSACAEWNTLVEQADAPRSPGRARGGAEDVPAAAVTTLDRIDVDAVRRWPTGMAECDRVLGGGVVPGALVLLGGDPGIGKSTLALELAARAGAASTPALYCAGEESAAQLAMRAARTDRAGPGVAVAAETDLDTLLATIEARRPPLAVIDSVQTLYDPGVAGVPGSVSQVRDAVARLLHCAKATGVPILLIGHVTKDGAIAGPRTLEHMVDVVLYLEGERHGEHRLLRGVKNRFGPTDEIGVLVLDETGIRESDAPGRAFLDDASFGSAGSVLTVSCEGSRPLAVEVQALVAPTPFGLPRRTASGFDLARLHVLLAILEKRAGIPLGQADVYVNAVGGVRLSEPAADLAVALAVAGAARDLAFGSGCVAVGELGLGGEVRAVRRVEQRLAEAAALGVPAAIVPLHGGGTVPEGMRCHRVGTLREALRPLG